MHTDGVKYTDFDTNASGMLTISVSMVSDLIRIIDVENYALRLNDVVNTSDFSVTSDSGIVVNTGNVVHRRWITTTHDDHVAADIWTCKCK